jgi:hypothetical protein
MSLAPWQRIALALARGIRVQGRTARYVCEVRHLTPVPHDPAWTQTITVTADSELAAAREVAALVARQFYPHGQAGFISENQKPPFL